MKCYIYSHGDEKECLISKSGYLENRVYIKLEKDNIIIVSKTDDVPSYAYFLDNKSIYISYDVPEKYHSMLESPDLVIQEIGFKLYLKEELCII